jgi:hypothetical protein
MLSQHQYVVPVDRCQRGRSESMKALRVQIVHAATAHTTTHFSRRAHEYRIPRFIREHHAQMDFGAARVASSRRLCDSKKYGIPRVLRYGISGDGSNLRTNHPHQKRVKCKILMRIRKEATTRYGTMSNVGGLVCVCVCARARVRARARRSGCRNSCVHGLEIRWGIKVRGVPTRQTVGPL